ncbi:rhodanese-like domain-containing protein [Thalassobaculum litoreum]|uniref:Rhodanese-related sulfurtransferase n=1 Tax=Thalassobaculum litoreum DSM 18839 TaxID=1123362 RepID=A0A8G2EXM3_9PROT|nr:rhodanese-like domain-containing protein [Thalassobaculum litoreum]SDF44211.1 Rhodanese-related sulfurtransferase [Thalassobaculum litoreum DSM 18839]
MRYSLPLLIVVSAAILGVGTLYGMPHWGLEDGRLNASKAHAMATRGEIRIIDVRAEREWRETGLAEGAVGASIHNPRGRDGFIAAALVAVNGDRDRPIATIAETGVRSTRARAWLVAAGFTEVYDIKEGMFGRYDETGVAPGWLNRGLPVVSYPN